MELSQKIQGKEKKTGMEQSEWQMEEERQKMVGEERKIKEQENCKRKANTEGAGKDSKEANLKKTNLNVLVMLIFERKGGRLKPCNNGICFTVCV